MWKILDFFKVRSTKNSNNTYFKEKINSSKNQELCMDEIMDNIFQSKKLYDSLKVKCHPDRFTDLRQKKIATDIYQNITKCKTDYQQLLNIRERVKQELGIFF